MTRPVTGRILGPDGTVLREVRPAFGFAPTPPADQTDEEEESK